MDAFLTPEQRELRRAARALARETPLAPSGQAGPGTGGRPGPARELGKLGFPGFPAGRGRPLRLFEAALVLEEFAACAPGRARPALAEPSPDDRAEPACDMQAAVEIGWLTGAASFILEGCYASARRRGLFESTLMEFRTAQQDLGDGLSALDAVRFRAYRALLLIDAGRRGSGAVELARALEGARLAFRSFETLGRRFRGDEWTQDVLRERPPAAAAGREPMAARPFRTGGSGNGERSPGPIPNHERSR